MQATHSVHVPISPEPSATAQEVHIIDNLATGSLVFIGKIWDKYCIAIFTKYNVKIIKDGNLIIAVGILLKRQTRQNSGVQGQGVWI